MNIDLLVSVSPKAINDLGIGFEEYELKNEIMNLLIKKGYKDFTVKVTDLLKPETDNDVVLD